MPRNLTNLLQSPRRLLLLDAVGALVTALATTLILAPERVRSGLPSELLYVMGAVAGCFACFDVVALHFRLDPSITLRIVACANLSYCAGAAASLYVYHARVTNLGFMYFFIEIPMVVCLAVWEWKSAKMLSL